MALAWSCLMPPLRDERGRFIAGSGGSSVTLELDTQKIQKAVEKANFENFGHAAASIAKTAKTSLVRKANPRHASTPGSPPHTHKGVYLKRAIRYARYPNGTGAIIGPMATIVGDVGAVHEFGERRNTANYPLRPFMRPALDASLSRFAKQWRGTVGG